ncbi:P-loop NTPase [Thermogladius sp. 4427co]|uniref:P-loop NTPase n=1 Tax=Thermogladius sp. 4427co TaxID=3450718 RepID=UPI003F792F17
MKKAFTILSSKGGVGKTVIATLLSYYAAEKGFRIGLLDLDFSNPSTHVVLGVDPAKIEYVEDKGILPYKVNGLSYVTPAVFTRDLPTPLRGDSIVNAIRELLSIVRLDNIEYLMIDTAPGMSDEHLEIIYMLRRFINPIVVTTPSSLSVRSVEKIISILNEAGFRNIMVIENMGSGVLKAWSDQHGLNYLGYIPYEPSFENCIGGIGRIRDCRLRPFFEKILDNILH